MQSSLLIITWFWSGVWKPLNGSPTTPSAIQQHPSANSHPPPETQLYPAVATTFRDPSAIWLVLLRKLEFVRQLRQLHIVPGLFCRRYQCFSWLRIISTALHCLRTSFLGGSYDRTYTTLSSSLQVVSMWERVFMSRKYLFPSTMILILCKSLKKNFLSCMFEKVCLIRSDFSSVTLSLTFSAINVSTVPVFTK